MTPQDAVYTAIVLALLVVGALILHASAQRLYNEIFNEDIDNMEDSGYKKG